MKADLGWKVKHRNVVNEINLVIRVNVEAEVTEDESRDRSGKINIF